MSDLNHLLNAISIFFIFLTGLLTIISLIRFSSILIKLVVLEILTNLMIAAICLWALTTRQPIFIDICIPLSLVMFLGVVAFYQFLLNRKSDDSSLAK